MKKASTEAVSLIGAAVSIVLFFISCACNIRNGYARDAGIHIPDALGCALILLPLICTAAFVGFLLLARYADCQKTKPISSALIVFLVLYGLFANLGWLIAFHYA